MTSEVEAQEEFEEGGHPRRRGSGEGQEQRRGPVVPMTPDFLSHELMAPSVSCHGKIKAVWTRGYRFSGWEARKIGND
jgi:hypothetical protein